MSAILSVDDLNDFISPGVACIKPVETLPAAPSAVESTQDDEVILDGQQLQQQPHPASTSNGAAPAQISLTDCLACSGCVTSAEAVLVSLQSHAEVLHVLDSGPALRVVGPDARGNFAVEGLEDESRKLYVASVSPQTRASLAAACGNGVTERQAGHMLERLLGGGGGEGLRAGGRFGNGFAWVVDTNAAQEACLMLSSDEALNSHLTSAAAAAAAAAGGPSRPILSSSCPGWVCYAEKTHPHVLPHLSRVKSPQALMGTLLKTTLSRTLDIPPDRIWHLAIMPCFDKKLEASREELTDSIWAGDGRPGRGVRDVDCVITSKEIFMLTDSRGLNFFSLPSSPLPIQARLPFPDATLDSFLFPAPGHRRPPRAAGSSGGSLYHILQDVLSRNPASSLQTTRGRNADVVEYTVTAASGEPIFRSARYYGFRNIQNLVRRLKPAKPSKMPGGKPFGSSSRKPPGKSAGLEYAYVEVMACPGGCTNGGGQVRVDDQVIVDRKGLAGRPGPQEQKDWLAQVDEAYFSSDDAEPKTGSGHGSDADAIDDETQRSRPSYVRDTLAHWACISGVDLDRLAYTSYREVVSDVGKTRTGDTDRVARLAGKIDGGW